MNKKKKPKQINQHTLQNQVPILEYLLEKWAVLVGRTAEK